MADGYMVVREDDAGMQYDEPMSFDTEAEAVEYATKGPPAPQGYAWALYRLEYLRDPNAPKEA